MATTAERNVWWKIAMHVDEAQLALVNAMAIHVDDPAILFVLQEKLRESQAILLGIFRAKNLLPAPAAQNGANGIVAAPVAPSTSMDVPAPPPGKSFPAPSPPPGPPLGPPVVETVPPIFDESDEPAPAVALEGAVIVDSTVSAPAVTLEGVVIVDSTVVVPEAEADA